MNYIMMAKLHKEIYYNGYWTAGQTMAGFFSSRLAQLGAIYAHLMYVFVPGLNSGRLAVYSCDHAYRNLHLSCRVAYY